MWVPDTGLTAAATHTAAVSPSHLTDCTCVNPHTTNLSDTTDSMPVTIYTDCGYQGTAVQLDMGQFLLTSLTNAGFPNDALSSIQVASGYQATLYSDNYFGGQSLTVTADTT